MNGDLLRLTAHGERDVFAVRQRGREVSAALGFDEADQVRIATALSEVCRYLLSQHSTAVMFRLNGVAVEITLEAFGTAITDPEAGLDEGVRAAARLMDSVDVTRRQDEPPAVASVVLRRRLPPHVAPPEPDALERIRAELSEAGPTNVLGELGVQNAQLIAALEEVQQQRDELLRLNAELEETNRGVMALYSQLSAELEETNRGVVALYAELDERSAQLRDASEAKSRFLRNVSHELRAPVTAVIGMLRLLLDPHSDALTEEQRRQLSLAQTSAGDLLSLVNELLDLAKAESNRLEPAWRTVDLRAVFSQLRGTLRHLARPDVELVVEGPVDVPVMISDEVLLVQILRNLLTNGLKFTGRGDVRLAARYDPAEDVVRLVVSDTGIGIGADDQERVFEEFYQVRGAQQANAPGTGLGLPYARRLAMLLGGTLTLASTPGQGSTFTVTLPRSPAGVAENQPAIRPAGEPSRPPQEVLVVDDDAAFRYRMRRVLEAEGVRVVEAGDGRDALVVLEANRPDAILLDLRMPGMGGLELLGELSKLADLRTIPVLVVTAAELDDIARISTSQAAGVLDKATLSDQQLVDALWVAVTGGAKP